jgi:hypothetical protein
LIAKFRISRIDSGVALVNPFAAVVGVFTNNCHKTTEFLCLSSLNGCFFHFPTFCLETKPTYAKASAGREEPKIQADSKTIIH